MEPTPEMAGGQAEFAAATDEFFAMNDLVAYQFHDAETAVQFLYSVDDMIEAFGRNFDEAGVELSPLLVYQLGCVVGEAYRIIFNGTWVYHGDNDRYVVEFTMPQGDVMSANVFYKVEKRFDNGDEDSLAFMFEGIKNMYLEQIDI